MKKRLLFAMSLLLLINGLAYAGPPGPLDVTDEQLAPYKIKRDESGNPAEPTAAAGQRFMAALTERDAEVASLVRDAVRYEIQDEETRKFARQKKFVLVAYGVIWALLAGFALAMWLRQRSLILQIRRFESRFSDDEDDTSGG